MKKLSFALIGILFVINSNMYSQNEISPEKNVQGSLSLSGMVFNDPDAAEAFGTITLLGGSLEKDFSDNFGGVGFLNLGTKTVDEETLKYTEIGAGIQYFWLKTNGSGFNGITTLGLKNIWISVKDDSYSASGSCIGFYCSLGFRIPLSDKTSFGIFWDSTWATMTIDRESGDVGSQIFSGVLTFNF